MKTVQDYLDLGLVFVGDDELLSETNNKDSEGISMSRCWLVHNRYDGFLEVADGFFSGKEWTPSAFSWRNNDGVKPEYKGLIHAMFENGAIIQDVVDSLNWGSSFNPVIQWRPVVLQSDDAQGKSIHSFVTAISIDGPKFTIKEEAPKTTMTVNIEGRDYLLVSRTPTVSPKEDKPMRPVYTAEMHAKGELPPVGAECILIVNNEPRPAKVTYIGKDIVCCSNIDGDAEYACLLGLVSFEPIPKTIKVNGFDVPAPMSEAPEIGDEYFTPQTGYAVFYCANKWICDGYDHRFLSRGLVHATESAAIAHAKAMLGIDPTKDAK